MTFSQLGQALAAHWPDHPPAALAQAVRAFVPLVQLPPRAVWGKAGQSVHTSAAPRLVAEFDNLVLSHAERSRVISPGAAGRISTVNGVIPGTVLIDGFVSGMWRLERGRAAATLTIELFGPDSPPSRESPPGPSSVRDALAAEAGRVLAFGAPGVPHHI